MVLGTVRIDRPLHSLLILEGSKIREEEERRGKRRDVKRVYYPGGDSAPHENRV